MPILRARERASRVKVVSLYVTPGVHRGIVAKSIQASVVQPNVTTARISMVRDPDGNCLQFYQAAPSRRL